MEAAVGGRLLAEVEETSLEEILNSLRASFDQPISNTGTRTGKVKLTHLVDLDKIAVRHFLDTQFATVSVSGRSLPLLYKVVSKLISPPHNQTMLVVDLDGRFDAASLDCSDADLQHVYIQRPARASAEHLRAIVADAANFMLYDEATRSSRSREWWGTIVLGGLAAGDMVAGWKGWLRVDRTTVPAFALGISAEEALKQRPARQRAVDEAGWTGSSQWGEFVFQEARDT